MTHNICNGLYLYVYIFCRCLELLEAGLIIYVVMEHMYTLQCASDIGINQCILSQAGMNAVVCAFTDIL